MGLSKRQIEIVLNASKIIHEEGMQHLTTKRLAEEMKFSEAALYRHFKGKNDILKSIIVYAKSQMLANAKIYFEEDTVGLDSIKNLVYYHLDFVSKNPAIAIILFSETMFQFDPVLSNTVLDTINQFKGIIENQIEKGQEDLSIRNDIDKAQLSLVILGSMRLNMLLWRFSEMQSEFIQDGEKMWKTIKQLIKY